MFAKADPRVAQFYETGLVPKELWGFGEDLRKKFHMTKSVLLKVCALNPTLPYPPSHGFAPWSSLAEREEHVSFFQVLPSHQISARRGTSFTKKQLVDRVKSAPPRSSVAVSCLETGLCS